MPTFSRIIGIGGVGVVHVVALFVGHHLERQLVVVAEEERPLARRRELGRLPQDVDDRVTVLLPHGHEDARHQREVEPHVALVAVAEVRAHVGGPLVRFGEQHAVGIPRVELAPHPLQDGMRLGQVLVRGALAHTEVRHRVEPQGVDPEIEPEHHHVDDRGDDLRIVVIQIGLVREEPVPVVLPGDRVVRPVRLLGVGEDDARFRKLLIRVAPDVELPFARAPRRPASRLEPRVLVGRVVDDQLDQHPDAARVRLGDQHLEVVERAVARVHIPVVRDVVPVVLQRRREEREQPEACDAEVLQVIELAREAWKIADAVVGAVEERLDVRFVDDGVLVPERDRR